MLRIICIVMYGLRPPYFVALILYTLACVVQEMYGLLITNRGQTAGLFSGPSGQLLRQEGIGWILPGDLDLLPGFLLRIS